MDTQIWVIGLGDDGRRGLSEQHIARIQAAHLLVGGERQLAFFPEFTGRTLLWKSPLAEVVATLAELEPETQVVVLASGDPLFYGIGSYLIQSFGATAVTICPHLSSVQLAFARAGVAWQDARLLSLHGRSLAGLAQKINGASKVALLTDAVHTPATIASYLLAYGMEEYVAFVAENLAGPEERTGWYTLTELATAEFSPLNVVLLRQTTPPPRYPLGILDAEFAQRKPDRGLITKREVRVLSLAELQLNPGDVLWDIGACTGSISIEAILQTPGLQVFAIEKNAEDLIHLRENQVKFRTDFVAVQGRAPQGLDAFPDPDAVFIGGSGGELVELLEHCASRLRPKGRIVVNAATIETLSEAYATMKRLSLVVSLQWVQTARSKPILNLTRFEGMNPVTLITGRADEISQRAVEAPNKGADV
ncbi:precorrin-6y C5,15-methyltransferase (decarboxylating) subunit CbiE [Alicyclobacillaceae bacterium I2511]|nr:precorrin-6y C5,15-methyltransferase (decarboxylating) subunit CbiE [Alicyclobacillaceae bacterium I2511]